MSKVKLISEQLKAFADGIETVDKEELCGAMLDISGALVGFVNDKVKKEGTTVEEIDEIIASVANLGTGITEITTSVRASPAINVAEMNKILHGIHNASEDAKKIAYEIEKLEPDVKKRKAQKECDEAKIAEYRDLLANDLSDAEIKRKEDERLRLFNDVTQKQATIAETEKSIEELKKKIASLPNEQKIVAEYDELKKQHVRLKNASRECSIEKRTQLRNDIAELEKKLKSGEDEKKKLEEMKEKLEKASTHYDNERLSFESDFIKLLIDRMDSLKMLMKTHADNLAGIEAEGKQILDGVAKCEQIRMDYAFMFETYNKCIEKMSDATGMDYENLRKTMDASKSERVEKLKKALEDGLKELEVIIKECREAVGKDQEIIIGKAVGK